MTGHCKIKWEIKPQEKTTKLITVTACDLFILHLLGFPSQNKNSPEIIRVMVSDSHSNTELRFIAHADFHCSDWWKASPRVIEPTPFRPDNVQQDWCEKCCLQGICGQWWLSLPGSTVQQRLWCSHASATLFPKQNIEHHVAMTVITAISGFDIQTRLLGHSALYCMISTH